ncbi:MAG: c-type cytochrome [Candidatus Cyclobacteriaceae bacterium M3_2C_046]
MMKKNILFLNLFLLATIFIYSFTSPDFDLKESKERGEEIYINYCLTCHMEDGKGIPGIYPPLAQADYLMENKERAIHQTIFGANGPMVVNGVTYNQEMLPQGLNDQQTADVLNYVRNTWENKGEIVTPEEVAKVRAQGK